MCDKLALTEAIRERACEIYKDYKDIKSLRGRKAVAFYAACIYLACRIEAYPRTFKEINATAPEASKKEIAKCFRLVYNEMQDSKGVSLDVGSVHPSDYMVRHPQKIASKFLRDALDQDWASPTMRCERAFKWHMQQCLEYVPHD